MKDSYRFFRNYQCEYFPCHRVEDPSRFSCLFCYCPLYREASCPGQPEVILDGCSRRIRDCSDCTYPHDPDNYDEIMSILTRQDEILEVSAGELYDEAAKLVYERSGGGRLPEGDMAALEKTSRMVYQHFFRSTTMQILLQQFDPSCVKPGGFLFGRYQIPCRVLERLKLNPEDIKAGYLYAFHSPEPCRDEGDALDKVAEPTSESDSSEEDISLLEQYYINGWQVAMLDAARIWLKGYLKRRSSVRREHFVTDSFGPGFYGMKVGAVEELYTFIRADRVGISLTGEGTLSPAASLTGIYLVLDRPVPDIRDCVDCIGSRESCIMCLASRTP